jgi:hypothetical protein
MVKIDTWKNEQPELAKHFAGAVGVVSCLGHRQPGWKNTDLKKRGLVAHAGNKQVIAAMKEAKVERAVGGGNFIHCNKWRQIMAALGIQGYGLSFCDVSTQRSERSHWNGGRI